MSQRTDDLYLVDLLDSADAIGRSLSGIAFEQEECLQRAFSLSEKSSESKP